MNYKIIFLILGFASVHSLKSQTNGFFINYTPEDSIRYSIKYHIKQPDNLIYILNKEDFSRNGSKSNGSFLIKSNYQEISYLKPILVTIPLKVYMLMVVILKTIYRLFVLR
jgi:hypothetical protein